MSEGLRPFRLLSLMDVFESLGEEEMEELVSRSPEIHLAEDQVLDGLEAHTTRGYWWSKSGACGFSGLAPRVDRLRSLRYLPGRTRYVASARIACQGFDPIRLNVVKGNDCSSSSVNTRKWDSDS